MNPEDPNVQAWLEPELEARLVASLLGEASAFEEAELARLIAERPEIAVFQRRLQAVHGLVGEASTQGPDDDDWKLSKERRSTVLEAIRGKAEKDEKIAIASASRSRKSFWYGTAAVASVAIFVGVLITMSTSMSLRSRPSIVATRETDETSTYGLEAQTPEAPRIFRSRNAEVTLNVTPQTGPDGYAIDMDMVPEVVEFEGFVNYGNSSGTDSISARMEESIATASGDRARSAAEAIPLDDLDEAEQHFYEVLRSDQFNSAARSGIEDIEKLRSRQPETAHDQTRGELLDQVAKTWETPAPKASTSPAPNGSTIATTEESLGEIAQAEPSDLALVEAAPAAEPEMLAKSRFARAKGLLTARSNGPELNVHGRPRMDLWNYESNDIDPSITRDFDNGVGGAADGAYVNKPDDGDDPFGRTPAGASQLDDVANDPFGAAPEIVTQSGSKAKVAAIRELIDPEEYVQPELSQEIAAVDETVASPAAPTHWAWDFDSKQAQPSASSKPGLSQAQEQQGKLSYFAKQDTQWADSGATESLWASQPGMIRTFPRGSDSASKSYEIGGAFTSVDHVVDYASAGDSEADSKSSAEDKPEPYAELTADDESGFGQIAGVNLIGRNLNRDEAVAEHLFGDDPEGLSTGAFSVAGVLTDPQFQATMQQSGDKPRAEAQLNFDIDDDGLAPSETADLGGHFHNFGESNKEESTPESRIKVEAKFVEVPQDNLKDFGFDWDLEGFGLSPETAPGQRSNSEQIVEQEVSLSNVAEKFTNAAPASQEALIDALKRDPHNAAARQELEQLELKESPMLAKAYEQTRAKLLTDNLESKALSEQKVKVEEARLGMLDLAERYRIIDFAAIQNRSSQSGDATEDEAENSEAEDENVRRYALASKTYEAEKKNLRRLEEQQLSEALVQKGTGKGEAILHEQLEKLDAQKAQVGTLGGRYQIPELLKRQSEAAGSDRLSVIASDSKKNTSEDDQRKLAEFKEAEEELAFRRKLVKKAKQALQPAKPQQPLNEKHAKQEPFSTFSLHVSDVAFKLAKAALLEQNKLPEVAKVRVEEFVNAFDYGDPAPSHSEKVACQTEQAAHPFRQQRNVLRVSMRTAEMGRSSGTPLQITLLLDTSGSMERADRQESIERAMQVLTSQLTPNDTVTLIGFARQPRLIQDRLTGEALTNLPKFVKQTPSEGGTNLEEALLLGATHARRQFVEGGQNRVVLLTDGAANLGDADAESLRELVVDLRQEGIAFDACGVGAEGLNDTVLEALTRDGDGRYYLLNKPEDADAGFARQLAGAFRPAARNVKVQVRFNDQRVGNYRLLGFEKHRLKKEDFRNDKVDAAEMASAEAGVALYEIEPLPQGDGEIGEVSVRFQDMTTGQMVERTWPIAYDAGVPALEDAAPSLQLASTAAFLGEKLKQTTFGETIDLEQLSQTLTNLRQCYGSSQRVKDLIAMIGKAKDLQ